MTLVFTIKYWCDVKIVGNSKLNFTPIVAKSRFFFWTCEPTLKLPPAEVY